MGFIKEKYSNNRAGLVVSFQDIETNEDYINTDSVEEAMRHFHLYLKDNQMFTESEDAIALEKIGVAVEEANELRALMDNYAVSLSDDDAMKNMILFANWSDNAVAYKAEQRVRYLGRLYKVLQDHTSQSGWAPNVANSLFVKILTDEEKNMPQPWEQPDSTNGYPIDSIVLHNGLYWKSLLDDNVWEPGVSDLWKEVNSDGSDIAIDEPNAIQEYMAGTLYHTDDQVIFEEKIYKSIIDNNSWSPTDYPAGWEEITE